jgi:hypothetical protein
VELPLFGKLFFPWELKLEGIPEFAGRFVKNNISEITQHALDKILRETEHR